MRKILTGLMLISVSSFSFAGASNESCKNIVSNGVQAGTPMSQVVDNAVSAGCSHNQIVGILASLPLTTQQRQAVASALNSRSDFVIGSTVSNSVVNSWNSFYGGFSGGSLGSSGGGGTCKNTASSC